MDRLFGPAAAPSTPKPRREHPEAPQSLRWAALVVGVQAALVAVGAVYWLWLTLTSDPESFSRAIAEVVILALVAAGLAASARGLARIARWARGPVIAAQIFFGLSGFVAAFEAQRPLIGLPVLALVAAVLYLLAAPESRLAYLDRDAQ
jgi:mannose/fructose/N-acetylgalactosamine-specific phosphotransferase system component IIC